MFVRTPSIRKKHFTEDCWKGTFLGYVPHTNGLMLFYDKGSNEVTVVTHTTFDEGLNDNNSIVSTS